MRRTFFIIVLAVFFTIDIFFAISTAVADNLKGSSNLENISPQSEHTQVIVKDIANQNTSNQFSLTQNLSNDSERKLMNN